MTKMEIEAQIDRLTLHFGLRPITVVWLDGPAPAGWAEGLAFRKEWKIRFCTQTEMPLADLARHEFAHMRDYHQHPTGRHRANALHHDETFYRLLLEVIDADQAFREAHPWHLEYQMLNYFARRDGLTNRPTVKTARKFAASDTALQRGIKVGVTVTYTSPGHGVQTGVVVSARYGSRVRVRINGEQWMVPAQWLQVVRTQARSSEQGDGAARGTQN
jgi:hypothetical protein